jgi:hypothetical protein
LVWLGLWNLMPLFTILQLYRGGQFYWWRKPEYPEKTRPVASHCWHTLSHVVSSIPLWVGLELTTLLVIRSDCIGSCKSNYHTITKTMAPLRHWHLIIDLF